MNSDWFFGLACAGLLVSIGSSIGMKVLHDFSLKDLEFYCRKRERRNRFSEILDEHDRAIVGAESLQVIGVVLLLLAGCLYLVNSPDGRLEIPTLRSFLTIVLVGTLLLLAVTSWLPLIVVRFWSAPFLYHTWWFWKIVSQLSWPFHAVSSMLDALLLRLAGKEETKDDEEEAFEDEIRTMVNEGLREGLLEEDAREMIEGVIELGDVDVSQIMTPRSEIDALDVEASWLELVEFVINVGRTRIPVYEDTLDNVLGILYAKDLLAELAKPNDEDRTALRDLLRDTWMVPLTKAVDDLLQDFRHNRNHMAIVVDEYRAVAGVVTIEDALEEIVGEIVDETDQELEEEIVVIDAARAEADGRAHVDDINEQMGVELPENDDYDTIGGFVISQLGYIPSNGESINWQNIRIMVLDASQRRIERVRIEVLDEVQRETV